MRNPKAMVLIRNLAIEVLVYGPLVLGYFLLVLRLLGEPLEALFVHHLTPYACVALALILIQGAGLEVVTSLFVQCGLPHRAGYAHRCGHRSPDRSDVHPFFRPANPAALLFPAFRNNHSWSSA